MSVMITQCENELNASDCVSFLWPGFNTQTWSISRDFSLVDHTLAITQLEPRSRKWLTQTVDSEEEGRV